MKELVEIEVWNRISSYCSIAEHCRLDVFDKMRKWGVSEEITLRILDRLETENYINEERYSCAFVKDKYRFSKWGKMKISQALQQKNISAGLRSSALETIDQNEYIEILRNLLSAKQKNIHAKNKYEKNGKLIRFALGRGFEMKDIRLCLQLFDDIDPFL